MHRLVLGRVPGGRRRRRLGAALALLAAVAVVLAIVIGTESPPAPKSSNVGTSTSGTATVERRDLVATDTEAGTLSYAGPHTVYDRLSGTITWLPRVGALIKPGQTLLEVSGAPVLLMDGTTPAYRDLGASDGSGRDVLQLNRNLVDLGFNPDGIVIDDVWQPATTAGVDLLQASLGQTETGALSLGQIVFLPGDQLISSVDATLGSTGGGSGAASPSSPTTASLPLGGRVPQFVSLATGHRPTGPPTLVQLTALLKVEAAQLRAATAALRAAKGSSASKSPPDSGTASAVLQTTSTRQIVTVNLSASNQSEATVGEKVSVELPAGNAIDGRITGVSRIARTSTSSSSPGATIPVTITLGRHRRIGLDQATVSVNFAQARARHVLSVPVTALLATSGGDYAVQAAAAAHTLIPVTTGLFAAGDVQISGAGIYPGLLVTDSQG